MKLRSGKITSPSIIGYKIAKAGETRVVVTLEIPDDAVTNVFRKDIVNVDTAKHRTNKAKVLKIEDETGKQYSSAESFNYGLKSLKYVVDSTLTVNDYDMDLEKVCSTGIHFFLTRRCAELYGLDTIKNGLYERWHDNGQKEYDCMYVNGKRHGLYQSWHTNGQKRSEYIYVNGLYHGLCKTWYTNGQKYMEWMYTRGQRDGLQLMWFMTGQKLEESNYVNGKLNGLHQRWYPNGQMSIESRYVNDILNGLERSWYSDGQKKMECSYTNDKLNGLYQCWYSNGEINVTRVYDNGVWTHANGMRYVNI